MAIYWDKKIDGRLIVDDEFKRGNGLLVFDLYENGRVSIFQDSDLQVLRDKFESINESIEFNIDEMVEILKLIIKELEGFDSGKSIRTNK